MKVINTHKPALDEDASMDMEEKQPVSSIINVFCMLQANSFGALTVYTNALIQLAVCRMFMCSCGYLCVDVFRHIVHHFIILITTERTYEQRAFRRKVALLF